MYMLLYEGYNLNENIENDTQNYFVTCENFGQKITVCKFQQIEDTI